MEYHCYHIHWKTLWEKDWKRFSLLFFENINTYSTKTQYIGVSKALDGLNFVTGGSFKDIIFSVVLSGTQEILMKWQKWKTAKPCPVSLKIFNVFSRSVLLTEVTRTRWMEDIVCISWEVLQNIRKIFIPTFYFEKYEKLNFFRNVNILKKVTAMKKWWNSMWIFQITTRLF